MVKLKHFILTFFILLSVNSCNNDLSGFFTSPDINDRLRERDNFTFLNTLPPLSTGNGSYSFIVLTDIHIEDGTTWGFERLPFVISANEKIKFAVITGDITQNGSKNDLDIFINIANELALLGIPLYPVIGNHDIYHNNWSIWKENLGTTNYRIDGDEVTLLILDSANALFGKEQLDWLEKELLVTNRDVFVFTHTSLFAKGHHTLWQSTDPNERTRIISMLRNKCSILFTGHAHKRYINKIGNVEYITVDEFKETNYYCLVSVTNEGYVYTWKKL